MRYEYDEETVSIFDSELNEWAPAFSAEPLRRAVIEMNEGRLPREVYGWMDRKPHKLVKETF